MKIDLKSFYLTASRDMCDRSSYAKTPVSETGASDAGVFSNVCRMFLLMADLV